MRLPIEYNPSTSSISAPSVAYNDNKVVLNDVSQRLYEQIKVFPQEKIHLHTDRDYYMPGERIWFRAYIADAHTHTSLDSSRYVYVELVSPVDTLISRVMIRPENEMFYGHLFLSELIPEGNYTLRAYTRYMENLGEGYFFKKNIRIGEINGGKGRSFDFAQDDRGGRGNGENRESRGNLDDFDVTFYPEGGNLVEGVWNKVAFKALNRNGYPEIVTGEIVDETGTEITSVQTLHAGMGVFAYIPESEKKCFLQCQNENGLEKQFELPAPNPRAYALTVSQNNKKISVTIRKSPDRPNSPCYLLAQCRGEALYFSEWEQKNEYISFAEEGFPSGVIQFILFDAQMNPVSERLVFSKNFTHDVATIEFQTDKTSYKKREKVIATIREEAFLTPSLSGRRQGMVCSIAITDDADIAVDSSTTILSTLLLSSELKGYIENPAWYLQDDIKSTTALDYLMMTHGWRRYNVPEVVKGKSENPQIPYQKSQQLSGNARGLFSRPAVNTEVLIITEDGGYGITTTDEKGAFIFQDFEYPDSTTHFLRALSDRNNDRVELILDSESFPKLNYAPQSPVFVETGHAQSLHSEAFIDKAIQRSRYDEDMRVIHLSEVEVTASRIERKEEPRFQFWANSSSDATIRREEIERRTYFNMADYLKSVSGVMVSIGPYDRSVIRIHGSKDAPLMLVDGVPQLPDFQMNDLAFSEVESIDVFKFASAFGTRGAGGVISITTKKGEDSRFEREKLNYSRHTPLGHQNPVEFYSPKYETLESKHLNIPDLRTTIFWKPDVVISDENEEASFEFCTSDFSTTYSVVIEGLTTDGKIVRQVERIRVE